jgi:hypothetical protein
MSTFTQILVAFLAITASATASAGGEREGDGLLARAGGGSVTVATGAPFFAIAEGAVGVSDGFTLGVIAGRTPDFFGVGLRPRGRVASIGDTRFVVMSPVLFYPKSDLFPEPWFLARPTLIVEHAAGRARGHVEVGALGVACTDAVLSPFRGKAEEDEDEPMLTGLFDTVGVGGAVEVAQNTELFLDATLVTSGFGLPNGYPGIPVISNLGLQRHF